MSEPTKYQRAALALEARRLAMECAEGTAPDFGFGSMDKEYGQPCCALGHVGYRATGVARCPRTPGGEWQIVGQANDFRGPLSERHARLVFPLLALADALEAP